MKHTRTAFLKCPNGHHLCELCARMEANMNATEAAARARVASAERIMTFALKYLKSDAPTQGREWQRLREAFLSAGDQKEQGELVLRYAKKHKAKA